jgi:hypothetical protein
MGGVAENTGALDLSRRPDILDRFKDCSTQFWFDKKRGLLVGAGLALDVPKSSVTAHRDNYVRIKTNGPLHGFTTEWLFVPGFPFGGDGWQQNSVSLSGKIEDVRNALINSWGLSFAKGTPEGPDVDPKAIAYFSVPPKGRPSLVAKSPNAKRTTINCPVRRMGSTK